MKRINRLTERDLTRIVRKVIKEREEDTEEISIKEKLDDIFFGYDSSNIFTPQGEYAYGSSQRRLKKEITPKERKRRIRNIIGELEDYIDYLKSDREGEEDVWMQNPDYNDVWGD